jgi:carbon storage regulator
MLVLSRKPDESIMIGDDVVVTIIRVRGGTVRVGISAPKSVRVHRTEVYEAIEAGKNAKVLPRETSAVEVEVPVPS